MGLALRACANGWSHVPAPRSSRLEGRTPAARAHASSESWQFAAIARSAPRGQVRGVQPLPAQQRPTAPSVVQASASRTIFRLYSSGNRRVASAATSTSGASPGSIGLRILVALDIKLQGVTGGVEDARGGVQERRRLLRAAPFVAALAEKAWARCAPHRARSDEISTLRRS
jgi:hypothetical protein